MGQVTIISGVERRRYWSDEQKRALVMAVSQPGANVAEIAREADLRPGQIYRWRRQMFGDAQGFAAVAVQPDPAPPAGPAVVVELGNIMVRIAADTPPDLAAAVLRSLRR
ncbi:transposase [Sphingopyxis macrogoltabida]|jgi:transposase|uniref:Transposase n=1 Tax=Sphingopyxis macrogoltabida TaxID=33050 RepID=A0AAC8YYI4_SPHMC|nr:transposase [Sphingopyxis macrogoltabida]ALJ12300.1 transposase [Sphingopyxis macrogoltabida]AMU88467.1 transposase [Sphingopyxis macrogoltabida]